MYACRRRPCRRQSRQGLPHRPLTPRGEFSGGRGPAHPKSRRFRWS